MISPAIVHLMPTTTQKKFFLNDFFSKFHQIHRRLQISPHLLKTFLMKNFIFDNIFDPLDDDSDDQEYYNEKDANGSEIPFSAIQRRYIWLSL